MLSKEGFMNEDEVKQLVASYPSEDRMRKGPVAVAECVEEIPCNPCESACPVGAIHIGEDITMRPSIDFEKCVGCGACVAHCSGLAVFLMDKSLGHNMGTVSFPYEYPNVPKAGDIRYALDRRGNAVCQCLVKKVIMSKSYDRTYVVTVEVPVDQVENVRGIAVEVGR